jgi:hypothetical protein
LREQDLGEYSGSVQEDKDLPGIGWICSGFETSAPSGDAVDCSEVHGLSANGA